MTDPHPPRCTAATKTGRPCRHAPMLGTAPLLCNIHAGRIGRRRATRPPRRRCTAVTVRGTPCTHIALPDTEPPRCRLHEQPRAPQHVPCTARTRRGQPCRQFAMHGSQPPRCNIHLGHSVPQQGPPPDRRRCTANNRDGSRCRGWIPADSETPLCALHARPRAARQPPRRPCTALNRQRRPCRAHPVPGTDPPRCSMHTPRRPLAVGTTNANYRHGLYARYVADDELAFVRARFTVSHPDNIFVLPALAVTRRAAHVVQAAIYKRKPAVTPAVIRAATRTILRYVRLFARYVRDRQVVDTVEDEITLVRQALLATFITTRVDVPHNLRRAAPLIVSGTILVARLALLNRTLPYYQRITEPRWYTEAKPYLIAKGIITPDPDPVPGPHGLLIPAGATFRRSIYGIVHIVLPEF